MKTVTVVGGAGFIASHLEDALIERNYRVVSVDLLDADKCNNISHLFNNKQFSYHQQDANNIEGLLKLTKDSDIIFHLAANADVRKGAADPNIDYRNTLATTHSVLECMRINQIPNLFFSSTSAVYGKRSGQVSEETGGLEPRSYYGASKLASEALISSYSYMNDFNALILRFPNVVGPRLTHGVIFDFINKLKGNPRQLEILGDGKQKKQYVYITDLVRGIIDFTENNANYSVYNVSTESFTDVNTIADLVCEKMKLKDVEYVYTGGECGWKGDVPSFDFNIDKAKSKGWTYKYNSTESIIQTLNSIDI